MLTNIIPLLDSDLSELQKLLNTHTSKDNYLHSASYFAMTGRNGLYMIKKEDSTIVLCKHPNLDNTFLIYPIIGEPNELLLQTTMVTLQKMGANVQFARFEEPPFQQLEQSDVVAVKEVTLDWMYPIHTLDTTLVTEHKGGGFQHFRQKHNKLKNTNVTAINLDSKNHRGDIISILTKWAPNEKQDVYLRLLDMFDYAPLKGRVVYVDGNPVGFSIFEKTGIKTGIANAFAHIGLHGVIGASQHVMLDMCQVLQCDGFSKVCIGGSETDGLERFKRKLCPVESLQLNSWYSITGKRSQVHKKAISA